MEPSGLEPLNPACHSGKLVSEIHYISTKKLSNTYKLEINRLTCQSILEQIMLKTH